MVSFLPGGSFPSKVPNAAQLRCARSTVRSYSPHKVTVVSVFLMQGWAESQVSVPALSCDPRYKLRR